MQRLNREYTDLIKIPLDGVDFKYNENNFYEATFVIKGPKNTPYEGGDFNFQLQIKENYPFKAPYIKCLTKIYNPNINKDGEICQQIFDWNPKIKIKDLIQKIQTLMMCPNQPEPLVLEIAQEYNQNKELFEEKARDYTKKYAIKE